MIHRAAMVLRVVAVTLCLAVRIVAALEAEAVVDIMVEVVVFATKAPEEDRAIVGHCVSKCLPTFAVLTQGMEK